MPSARYCSKHIICITSLNTMTLRRVLSHCLPLQILKLKSVPRNHAARSRSRRCSQGATPWGLCSWPPFLLLTDDDDDELGVRGALAHWKSLAADCNLKCSQRCYLNADTVAVHQMTAADPIEVLWKCLLYKPMLLHELCQLYGSCTQSGAVFTSGPHGFSLGASEMPDCTPPCPWEEW